MATMTWIKNLLDENGVRYREVQHLLAFTAQKLAEREHVSGHRVAKVVVVIADGRPVELVLPASRRVSLEKVRKALPAIDVRLATEEEMERYFDGCEVGAIPALDHWKGVPVLMDPTMKVPGDIVLQGGTHRDAICLRFEDWFDLVKPRVVPFSDPADAH